MHLFGVCSRSHSSMPTLTPFARCLSVGKPRQIAGTTDGRCGSERRQLTGVAVLGGTGDGGRLASFVVSTSMI
jgi:hypothetical protein